MLMSCMFSYCSSLTFLNLSNFNANNVKDMRFMFNDLNKNCKVFCNDKKILYELGQIFEISNIYINPMDDFKKSLNDI